MPILKKPRSNAPSEPRPRSAPPQRRRTGAQWRLPGRDRRTVTTAIAQDVMYEAWERTTSRSRIAFARKTLRISPLCTDAYVLLADRLADLNRNIIVDGRLPNKSGLSE
jgi:hypothetical protein